MLTFRPRKSAGPDAYALAPILIRSDLITCAGRNILWLPHDRRRAKQFSFYGKTFASSGSDGTIALVEFDPQKIVLPTIGPPPTTNSQILPQPEYECRAKAGKWYRSLGRMLVMWATPRRDQRALEASAAARGVQHDRP